MVTTMRDSDSASFSISESSAFGSKLLTVITSYPCPLSHCSTFFPTPTSTMNLSASFTISLTRVHGVHAFFLSKFGGIQENGMNVFIFKLGIVL